MESNTLFSSVVPSLHFPSRKWKFGEIKRSKVIANSRRRESHEENHYEYGEMLVDESMIVLRKRIHEMKIIERNYEPPADWMDWEKHYYASYDHFICNFVGFLQFHLMNTRPSVALGTLFLITMTLPLLSLMIVLHFFQVAYEALSAVHLG